MYIASYYNARLYNSKDKSFKRGHFGDLLSLSSGQTVIGRIVMNKILNHQNAKNLLN